MLPNLPGRFGVAAPTAALTLFPVTAVLHEVVDARMALSGSRLLILKQFGIAGQVNGCYCCRVQGSGRR